MSNNKKTFEVLQRIDKELREINTINEYIAFCKYNYKLRKYDKVSSYKDDDNNKELKEGFPFLSLLQDQEIINLKNKNKNADTTKDFPLAFLKEKVLKPSSKTFKINNFENNPDNIIQTIQSISGIITDKGKMKKLIEKLPKYSFGVWVEFKLLEPYFSKDDDEFYIIQNPVLKEHVFKVPMVRGSSWKGALAGAFKKLLNDEDNNKPEIIESYLRIFGCGSDSIKEIESYLKEKTKDLKDFKDKVLEFMLFELGMRIDIETIKKIKDAKDENGLLKLLKDKISDKFKKSQSNLPIEFQTHKGRAIFYPTYFDKISLEIINPHDRKTRAGINPIHYEVVPRDTEGFLQIVYIPFDGALKKIDDLKEEVEQDLKCLCKAKEMLSNEGIGAKTKLGLGRFEIKKNYIF